ncbi:MAG: AAC(3) family N-acetyltransferase [Phycisphaerales bacterium]|nr:AAC(3) family N-acetyltransferase [Phycisphaerales bacterium]
MSEVVQEITREEIGAGLLRLGLKAGDKVMVHSSLKSFRRVQDRGRGGAETVILALQDVLTPRGTLMMPSFNHTELWGKGKSGIYDPRETRTRNGAIPEAFWRMREGKGVCRSLDPSHPIACWGKDAQRYVRFHHRTLTFGPESPLGMLGREGGMGLLLGVGYGPNTYHHVVEMSMGKNGTPCLGQRTEAYPVRLPDGRTVMGRTWGWRESRCPITDAAAYAPLMANREQRGMIGSCEAILFQLSDVAEVVSRLLREGMGEERGGHPPCCRCPIRPRIRAYTVASDWDAENGTLRADSEAWTY